MGRIDYIDDTIAPRPGEPSIATAAHFEWGRASRSRRHAAVDGGPNIFNALREHDRPHGANGFVEPVQKAGKHVHEAAAYLREAVAHVHPAVAYGHEGAEHVQEWGSVCNKLTDEREPISASCTQAPICCPHLPAVCT